MLTKPIFIKSSFKKPLFNKEMEKELLSAKEWMVSSGLSEEAVKYISRLIWELVDINNSLLNDHAFEELTDKYNCYREFAVINPKIKYSAICYVCNNAVMSKENAEKLVNCIRHLGNCFCSGNISDEDYSHYRFLHRFCISFFL